MAESARTGSVPVPETSRGITAAEPAPTTLRELLTGGAALLAPSSSARLDAELLLTHVLGLQRAALYREPERPVPAAAAQRYRALLETRRRGVPLAYLTGHREFFGRDFDVTEAVLVPRPETEALVELVIECCAGRRGLRVLDLGTGSGALAVTLAAELDCAGVLAVDRSAAALDVAGRNIARHGVAVQRLQGNWTAALAARAQFDVVVANPPYVASGDAAFDSGETRFEPRLALDGGTDGLDAVRNIAADCVAHLAAGGLVAIEHGTAQGAAVRALLADAGLPAPVTRRDLAGHERISFARHDGG